MEVLPILDYMRGRQPDLVGLIRALVEIESPTSDKAAVNRVADAVEAAVDGLGTVTRYPQADSGDQLLVEFDIPARDGGQVLGLGHLDTVWGIGTLERMPWRDDGERLWGPGVFDMKAGVAYLVFAARALLDLGLESRHRYALLLNADEEVGSPSSTERIKEQASRSVAVLVAEPSAGLAGDLKTARKGVSRYRLDVSGIAAHSGLDFASGASAVLELARQIERVSSWTDLGSGLTVNPGVIQGGTATNVVAASAWAELDVRVADSDQARRVDRQFRTLEPFDSRCAVKVSGGVNKPPLERTPGVVRLFETARSIAAEMDVELGETSVGGGSDGNTTAAMGIPTLDGVGAVGEGAHAEHESILVGRIADRAALVAELVRRL